MESESRTFHRGISGRHSHWWEGETVWRGKAMVLCGTQAHNTCTSRFLQKRTGESSHASTASTVVPLGPWVKQGALVLLAECLGPEVKLGAAVGNYRFGSALALHCLFTAFDFLYLLCYSICVHYDSSICTSTDLIFYFTGMISPFTHVPFYLAIPGVDFSR